MILAVVAAIFLYPFARVFSGAPDYGVFLNGADLVNHGAIPSRDFVEPQGPGSFWWLALLFRLFGTSLETARALLLATGAGLGLAAFYLSRKLGARGVSAAAFVTAISIPVLPMNSPHYDSNLFALTALAVFVACDRQRVWNWVGAALLCGVASWMIQQKGCYVALALLVSLRTWRSAGLFISAFTLTALAPFGYFAAAHALPQVWFANYTWPLSTYSELNAAPYGFPAWQNMGASPAAFVSSMPFVVVAALPLLAPAAAWAGGRAWFSRPMAPYWLAAYALWAAELHRLDIGHLRNGTVLLALLFFTICEISGSKAWRFTGATLVAALALAATLNLTATWRSNVVLQETRRGVVYMDRRDPLFDFLARNTRAGEEVFVYPYQPAYYFFEQLKNPTRYSYLNYHLHTAAQFREAVSDLEQKQVRYVVFDSWLSGPQLAAMFPAYRHPEKPCLIMEPYLENHYRLSRDLGRFQILERLDRAHGPENGGAQK